MVYSQPGCQPESLTARSSSGVPSNRCSSPQWVAMCPMTSTRRPDQHSPARPAQRQVSCEPRYPGCGLPPAFAVRIRRVDVLGPVRVQLGGRRSSLGAVIALPEPPVKQHRNRCPAERDRRGLGRAGQVGTEHGGDFTGPVPRAELSRLLAAKRRQAARQPAGSDAVLVVAGGRVLLEHDPDRHCGPGSVGSGGGGTG